MPAPGSPDDEDVRGPRVVYGKLTTMTDERQAQDATPMDAPAEIRDIHEVPAVEVITTTAVHLMTAAAVKCGLADSPDARELIDLDGETTQVFNKTQSQVRDQPGERRNVRPYLVESAGPIQFRGLSE